MLNIVRRYRKAWIAALGLVTLMSAIAFGRLTPGEISRTHLGLLLLLPTSTFSLLCPLWYLSWFDRPKAASPTRLQRALGHAAKGWFWIVVAAGFSIIGSIYWLFVL